MRKAIPPLQDPQKEYDEEILKDFLFNEKQYEEEMEKEGRMVIQALENQEVNTDETRKAIMHNQSYILFPLFPVS